jgi:hypothetical protein
VDILERLTYFLFVLEPEWAGKILYLRLGWSEYDTLDPGAIVLKVLSGLVDIFEIVGKDHDFVTFGSPDGIEIPIYENRYEVPGIPEAVYGIGEFMCLTECYDSQ